VQIPNIMVTSPAESRWEEEEAVEEDVLRPLVHVENQEGGGIDGRRGGEGEREGYVEGTGGILVHVDACLKRREWD